MSTFRDFCNSSNVTLRRDKETNQVGYMEHKVQSKFTGKQETYHIMTGDTADGEKILFIPSLGVFSDVMNGKMKFGDAEVVTQTDDNGNVINAKDGTRLLFLHKPATFAGTVSNDQLGF